MKVLVLALATASILNGSQDVLGQKYPTAKVTVLANEDGQQQQLVGDNGERVDKLASAAGDLYWQQQQLQPQQLADWYHQTLNKLQQQVESQDPETGSEVLILQTRPGARISPAPASWDRVEKRPFDFNSMPAYPVSTGANGNIGFSSGPPAPRNYHTLVDDYKHWASRTMSSNPMREGRAFRPRLMSTARGFGKRSIGGYNDNFGGQASSEASGRDGRMGPAAIR